MKLDRDLPFRIEEQMHGPLPTLLTELVRLSAALSWSLPDLVVKFKRLEVTTLEVDRSYRPPALDLKGSAPSEWLLAMAGGSRCIRPQARLHKLNTIHSISI